MNPIDYLVEQLQAPCRGIPSHIIEEAKIKQKQQFKQLLEEYTNRIVDDIGLVKTTSIELNSKDYQPFITDEDGELWTINKEHILSQLPKFLKENGYE